ncbi:MAG: type III PLP-dependent enzyme [Rickettsiales bacterium]
MAKTLRTIASLADGVLHKPLYIHRPHTLEKASRRFLDRFKGKTIYAVKTNPEPHILKALYGHGIRSFDVASAQEAASTRALLPDAELFFMHPVKSRFAIREAYFTHGVKYFSLDCREELEKILQETHFAGDLELNLRLAMPNSYAEMNLGEKFGATLQEAPELLGELRRRALRVGVSFHVGSQCMHPDAYRIAIRMAASVIAQSGVPVDDFNVGGGFPSVYPGMIPPPIDGYFQAIREEFAHIPGSERMRLMAEPGRAIVAESGSLLVRVELRKGSALYINDGTYGGLFDAGTPRFIFPVHLIKRDGASSCDLAPFKFYGPTCDSLDHMNGPFYLPNNVAEGDYIEIGQMGAYGRTLATGFNGFSPEPEVAMVNDEPLMTMYDEERISATPLEVIAA